MPPKLRSFPIDNSKDGVRFVQNRDLITPFHHWSAGALWALKSSDHDNSDCLAHAGNSLRELVEKLPRALGTEIIGPDANFLKQKRESAGAALIQVKRS